jgi:hypothetical protein
MSDSGDRKLTLGLTSREWILIVLIVIITIFLLGNTYRRISKQRDTALAVVAQLSSSYEKHLYADYRKDICELLPTLDAPRNKLTEKDRVCEMGVREKAKKEVAALMSLKK